jgi:hypothetical protein
MKTIKVVTPHGEFEAGAELTRPPHIAAYFMGVLNALHDKETTLTSPEIGRVVKRIDGDGKDDATVEAEIISELEALEAGADDDDVEPISEEAATAQRHAAGTMAARLNGVFNTHLVAVLDAGELVKKGPVQVADDCIAKWSMDEILAMPFPGSKPPKKGSPEADTAGSNAVYDYYKTGEERGSWCGDIILSTVEGRRLAGELQTAKDENDKAKDLALKDTIKDRQDRLNRATALLRKGLKFLLVMHGLKACPLLECEVQREADGTPVSSLYPVVIWQKGQQGKRKSLTLSQFLGLLNPDKDGYSGIDRTIAKGGTITAFTDHGLIKKAGGKKGGVKAVANVDAAYDTIFVLNTYLQNGGDAAIARMVNGPKSEAWVRMVGDLQSYLAPIYNSGDVAARYVAYNATPKEKKQAA